MTIIESKYLKRAFDLITSEEKGINKSILLLILITLFFLNLNKTQAQTGFQRLIGGADHDRAQTIFNTFDNGYIVNGASFSYGIGDVDAVLIKTDSIGQTIWSKAYGTITYDNSEFAIEASDHGIVCCGRSNIQNGFPTSAIIFKTDAAGNLQWTKAFGGLADDDLVQIIETSSQGFAAVGRSQSTTSGGNDVLLIKTDANGDTIFSKIYGTAKEEEGLSLIQLPDGGFVIAGRQISFPGGVATSDGILIRTDSSGNIQWSKVYGGSAWDELSAVRMTPDSGFIVTGSSISFGTTDFDVLLMKTDITGNPQWTKIFGGRKTDASYDIHIDQNGSYIMSGYTESLGFGHSLMGDDSANIFMMKTDTTGDLIWMEVYGDGLQDESFRSALANDGGYMIPGFTTNYVFNDSTQMILIKTDSAGLTGCHELRVEPADSFVVMSFTVLILNQLSGIAINTMSLTQTSFIPDNDNACLYSSVNIIQDPEGIKIYPNPFDDILNISTGEINSGEEIIITNLLGKIVFAEKIISTDFKIQTDNLEKGVFFISIKNKNGELINKKFLKM